MTGEETTPCRWATGQGAGVRLIAARRNSATADGRLSRKGNSSRAVPNYKRQAQVRRNETCPQSAPTEDENETEENETAENETAENETAENRGNEAAPPPEDGPEPTRDESPTGES